MQANLNFLNVSIFCSWALFWRICSHAERSGGVGVYLSELIKSISLDTLRENCGIIRKQASTDGGVLWEIMRVNVVQVREKDRSLRDPIEARSCVKGEAGGRERPNEDETGVTSRGREGKSAGREGLTAPKRVSRSTKNAVGRRMLLFCSRNEKKSLCKEKLTDATAGGTKLEPTLTLIPVLMRGKCV
ncbi:hypothetical protein TNCV_1528721 [Trichonephila clavipes]|nr:hypothetical protein TNCV_1528721 [Trichonephila clavipes]